MNYIYADTYILENLIMNYFILYITSYILRTNAKWYRLLSASALGTLYAFITLWMDSILTTFIGKILISILMVYISFIYKRKSSDSKKQKIYYLFKIIIVFYAITFIFAGASFALLMSGKVKNMLRYIIAICLSCLIINGFVKTLKLKNTKDSSKAEAFIQFERNSNLGIWLPAIIDTGNSLCDPFTGQSVIVAELSAIHALLPKEVSSYFEKNDIDFVLDTSLSAINDTEWKKRFRIIPFKAIGKENGILPAFKADIIKIKIKKSNTQDTYIKEINNVIVSIYNKTISPNNDYCVLLAPDMILKEAV